MYQTTINTDIPNPLITVRGQNRRYTTSERRRAVLLADDIGIPRAADHLGIPYKTLHNWVSGYYTKNLIPEPLIPPPVPKTTPDQRLTLMSMFIANEAVIGAVRITEFNHHTGKLVYTIDGKRRSMIFK